MNRFFFGNQFLGNHGSWFPNLGNQPSPRVNLELWILPRRRPISSGCKRHPHLPPAPALTLTATTATISIYPTDRLTSRVPSLSAIPPTNWLKHNFGLWRRARREGGKRPTIKWKWNAWKDGRGREGMGTLRSWSGQSWVSRDPHSGKINLITVFSTSRLHERNYLLSDGLYLVHMIFLITDRIKPLQW